MSAYSAEMLEACKTVTLKVKVLPIFRWDRDFSGDSSRGKSRPSPKVFTGLWGASRVAAWHGGRNTPTLSFIHVYKMLGSCLIPEKSLHLVWCTNWPLHTLSLPAQVLLLTSSAEIPISAFCPSPSTILSSSWEVLECDKPPGHDSDWKRNRTTPRRQHSRAETFPKKTFFFGSFNYLLKLSVFKGDLSSSWLSNSRAVIGGFLISLTEKRRCYAWKSCLQILNIKKYICVPEMACTATLRKPLTSPFSLTMATRCTRGTGYRRLLR